MSFWSEFSVRSSPLVYPGNRNTVGRLGLGGRVGREDDVSISIWFDYENGPLWTQVERVYIGDTK